MRVICVCNQKGGTGKTTTAWAILTGAAARGYRAIGIDMDIQHSLSFIMQADPAKGTITDVLKGRRKMHEVIQHTGCGDVVPASIGLATIKDVDALKKAMPQLQELYDIAVIDGPPTLSAQLLAYIRAADEVIIPIRADPMAEQGLYQVKESIIGANPDVSILGVFLTQYSGRTVLERDMRENIMDTCRQLQLPFLDTPVKSAVAVQEAQFLGKSLFTYAPRSTAAAGYNALLDAIGIKEKARKRSRNNNKGKKG